MQNRAVAGALGLAALLVLGAVAFAQGPGRGPGGRGFGRGELAFERIVANAPFYAVRVRTFSNTFGSNAITRSDCAVVARDLTGDTYEAISHNSTAAGGSITACSSPAEIISITNVSTNTRYIVNVKNSTYRQFTFRTPANPPTAGAHPGRAGKESSDQVSTQDLGSMAVAHTSYTAEGITITRTIPAGKIGNSAPIVITSTRWYSKDLGFAVSSTRNDPQEGTFGSTYTFSTTAAPPTLFALPTGLTLEQGKGPGGGWSGFGRH